MLQLLDNLIEQNRIVQGIRNLKELIDEANRTDRKECGNCDYWMKSSQCPMERNVNGRQKGPSMSYPACNKFKVTSRVVELKKKRLEAIRKNEFYNLLTAAKRKV